MEECFYDVSDNSNNKIEIRHGKIIDDYSFQHNTLTETIGRDFRILILTGNYDPPSEPNNLDSLFPAIEECVYKAKGYIGELDYSSFKIKVSVKIDFIADIEETE